MKQRYKEFEIATSDDNNYTLNKIGIVESGKTKGNETVTIVGFYNNIASAVKMMAKLCANKADDLNGWLVEYKKVKSDIEEMLK